MGIFDKFFGKSEPQNPEEDFKVTVTGDFVIVVHSKEKTEKIFWKDINEIKLINTDAGPLDPDVWLVLIGDNSRCSIPQGNKGYDSVYDIVSKYENFNFGNVIKSMTSTDNEEFLLWTRK